MYELTKLQNSEAIIHLNKITSSILTHAYLTSYETRGLGGFLSDICFLIRIWFIESSFDG